MLALLTSFVSSILYQQHEEKSFISWMRSTNQFYVGDEYHFRLGVYLVNSRLVQEHNKQNSKYRLSLNKFASYTQTEYRQLLGLRTNQDNYFAKHKIASNKPHKYSAAVDWRDKGVVNDIKDQGKCGSCWAFSVTQAVESVNAISTGTLLRYSEQELVDCVAYCLGCDGGNPYIAVAYIASDLEGKFNLESDYPYTGVDGKCKFSQYEKVGSVSDFIKIDEGDEDQLASKIEEMGPASVCIDAYGAKFALYSGGIYNDPACSYQYLNHAVGCVGFGVEDDTKYWIVRNSWGPSWGEDGYIRITWEGNCCGVATSAIITLN